MTAEDVDKAIADAEHADARRTVRDSASPGISRAIRKEAPSSTLLLASGVRRGVVELEKEVRDDFRNWLIHAA